MIAIVFLVVIVGGVNALYMRTNYYNDQFNTELIPPVPDRIKIASFGNSHCKNAIDWSIVSADDSVDFSVTSQKLMYDYSIFQQYYDLFEEGSKIIIGVSVRSLYEPGFEDTETVGADEARYYRALSGKYIYNYKWDDAFVIKYAPILNANFEQVMHIFHDTNSDDSQKDKENEEIIRLSNLSYEKLQVTAEERSALFMSKIGLQQKGVQYKSICAMIDKAAEKHMNVVLVTFPTSRPFSSRFSDVFYAQLYSDINDLCQRYNKTYYIDYTNDPQFADNFDLFRDVDHLNSEGSAVFMQKLMRDMEMLGLGIALSAGSR